MPPSPLPLAPHSPNLARALDRVEAALVALGDPFAELPIVVGDRAMEAWIRHRLAERAGIATGLVGVSVEAAVEGLVRAPAGTPWWRWSPPPGDPWGCARLRDRVLDALAVLKTDAPALVATLPVAADGAALAWRHLAFAGEVADVVLRLCHERPEHAMAWGRGARVDAADAPADWLARVCVELGTDAVDGPAAQRLAALEDGARHRGGPPLIVVGTTALTPFAARLLAAHGAEVFAPPDDDRELAALFRDPGTRGVRLRPCFGALREVEELRAWLLHHFESGALAPEEVLVASPAPDVYGPLFLGVCARKGAVQVDDGAEGEPDLDGDASDSEPDTVAPPERVVTGPPAIPVQARGLGRGRTNPVADVLLRVLELGEERVDAPRLVGLLGCGPLQARLGVDADEAAELQALLVESGARWAFDAADRSAAGQPALHRNTLEHGVERLALGRLMPTDTVVGEDGDAPVVAMEAGGRERAAGAATLVVLVRALEATVAGLRFAPEDTAEGWRARLDTLLAEFTHTSNAAGWLRLDVEERLDEVLPRAAGRGLALGAVRHLLDAAFSLPHAGTASNVGAVTFAPLAPHAARPFRVVALLGMNDGAFPRTSTAREWDPFGTPLPGELAPRTVDRRLLHDVAAAAGTLWVSWTAVEMKRGEALPACVPIEELAHALGLPDAATREAEKRRAPPPGIDATWRRPPRHAWGEAGAHIVDPDVHAAARALRSATPTTPQRADLPDPLLPLSITVDQLVDALVQPSRLFLKERLGVYLPEDDDPTPAREAVEVNKLGEYWIKEALREAWETAPPSVDAEAVVRRVLVRLAGRGELPLGAGGERIVEDLADSVAELWDAWMEAAPGSSADVGIRAVVADVPVAEDAAAPKVAVEVRGTVERLGGDATLGRVDALVVADPTKGKRRLANWVRQLVLCAGERLDGLAAPARVSGGVTGLKSGRSHCEPVPEVERTEAARILRELLGIWRLARRRPIPLFESTSPCLAAYAAATEDAEAAAALREAASTWSDPPSYGGAPERDDRWVAALHADFDPEAVTADHEAVRLAATVWGPLGPKPSDGAAAETP